VFAAAHVVPKAELTDADVRPGRLDWDSTLRQRLFIWEQGLGVAEAMDTSQRGGGGLSADDCRELITLTAKEARHRNAPLVVGVGTDALLDDVAPGLDDVIRAYSAELGHVQDLGAEPVIMCSRALVRAARSPEDYAKVYAQVLSEVQGTVLLHWLGPAFDPALSGYWGAATFEEASANVLELLHAHPNVRGIKMSLLDAAKEKAVRAALPESCTVFTGDDHNFADLMTEDDEGRFSHALLGAFAMMPHKVAEALEVLGKHGEAAFRRNLQALEPLSRLVFTAPASRFKVGVTWLAYLSGRQSHFRMLGGLESARSLEHLMDVYEAALGMDLFEDPELAKGRCEAYLAVHGLSLSIRSSS
jgi:hypothetical protein